MKIYMKIRMVWLTGVLFSCSFATFAQDEPAGNATPNNEILLRKLNVVEDIEGQLKGIPFAAVRVHGRYRLASWLWRNGKDETGRAEEIARIAIDDHYKNKDEIPPGRSYITQLFALLESNAKDVARELREKYNARVDESVSILDTFLKKGDKQAVDEAIRMLSRPQEKSPDLTYILMTLEQKGSPELYRLLGAVLAAEEASRLRSPSLMTIEFLSGFFIKPNVPGELQKQFIAILLSRSRNVAALSEQDLWMYYRTYQRLWPMITAKFPEMVAEAGTVNAVLSAKVSRSTREAHERQERINNSSDKLAATVAEAERAEDDLMKYGLFRSAARLALERKKFVFAVDLMEKASEIKLSEKPVEKDELFRKKMYDEFFRNVVTAALESNEPDGANHAVKKMHAAWSKGEGLATIAKHYIDKNDLELGRRAHDDGVRLIGQAASSVEGIGALIRMLPIANRLGPIYISELSRMIAKAINSIPTLNVEDKPDTKNYSDHVAKMMTISMDLQRSLSEMVKSNRGAAGELVTAINKKEIRVIGDYVLLTDSVDALPKPPPNSEPEVSRPVTSPL